MKVQLDGDQREIREWMGIDYSAVSVMRKRLSGLQKKDRNLPAEIERLKKRMQPSQGLRFDPNHQVIERLEERIKIWSRRQLPNLKRGSKRPHL